MTINSISVQHPGYLRVALQSALAAALFLCFPAGLLLWLVLFRESTQTSAVDPFVNLLQANGVNKINSPYAVYAPAGSVTLRNNLRNTAVADCLRA